MLHSYFKSHYFLETLKVDGKLEQQIDISKITGTMDTNYTTKIGVDGKGTLFGNNFNAALDEVSILKKAGTAEDAQKMYQSAPPISVTNISIDQPTVQLNVDGYTYLKADIKPSASAATNKKVTWKSSDSSIVALENQNDTINAKALKPGRVVLTASTEDGNYNKYVYIQVK
ncbi:hypothetical protein KOY_00143 [Bacillus cereus VDM021]|uniref:Uncharacterized protein n=1 Tax=Bacillus pseudomycoides TaxID=64104 RepID=A0A1Y3MC36_9BACI|nr:hypothetical protein IIW_00204 [Bacillus cereus VD136]EOQ14787.1 hypothetical protein KOY_00143 [Bacillus cereus VDM021]OUM48005.1 hypothetical protein BW425_14975 [Bacillus pseudomycoides]PEK72303.1 hypothetical protein CN590_03780 [Bacillus pseudomycoides]PEL24807.1 hypothetical protein CN608_17970 [Bacillus pseudomycoides]